MQMYNINAATTINAIGPITTPAIHALLCFGSDVSAGGDVDTGKSPGAIVDGTGVGVIERVDDGPAMASCQHLSGSSLFDLLTRRRARGFRCRDITIECKLANVGVSTNYFRSGSLPGIVLENGLRMAYGTSRHAAEVRSLSSTAEISYQVRVAVGNANRRVLSIQDILMRHPPAP